MKTTVLLIIIGLVSVLGTVFFLLPGQQSMELSGLVQAEEVKNTSRFGGRVKELRVKEGHTVQAGQVLVVLDDGELQAKLMEAQSLLDQAEAKKTLLKEGAETTDLQQAQSQVRQAEQQLKMLTRGSRPEEVVQGEAQVQDLTRRYDTAKNAYDNATLMLREGIISSNRYQEMAAQVRSAELALESARAQLDLLKTGPRLEEINIAKLRLSSAKANYQKLLDGARQGELDIASAAVDQAKSVVTALEDQLKEMEVKAPISGVVSVLRVHPGELVPPGQPMVSIIQYNNLWTDVFVPESKLDFIYAGQPVKVTTHVYPNTEFQGRVAFINPKSEFVPSRSGNKSDGEEATFRVKVSLDWKSTRSNAKLSTPDRAKQLFPGMKVMVYFEKEVAHQSG